MLLYQRTLRDARLRVKKKTLKFGNNMHSNSSVYHHAASREGQIGVLYPFITSQKC